jgi:eukaryotic-like serine/threonine-protein kinase
MQLTCRHCQKTIEFVERRPAACTACGRPLDVPAGDVTLDHLPTHDTDKTLVGGEAGAQSAMAEERVGEYRLLRPLGQGGMGSVWEAEQSGTGRRVALKLLSPRLSPTAENVDRFLREGKLAASVSHPRSTFVFGAGQQNGQPYIAMELMPGRTLKDVLDNEGPLPIARAVDYILDCIDGLEAAHALGVIHRDVKPSNCFLDSDGRVKVGDFGLSKSLVSDAELTKSGSFLGTPQFAAPEQVKGGAVDQRTDVYSVGATLFCLLAGRPPFEGDAVAVVAQIVSEEAPRLGSIRPNVGRTLDRIVARTLAKEPDRRFADLESLRRALAPFATGGVSMADVGRRIAAYMLDSLLTGTVSVLATLVFFISILVARSYGAFSGPLPETERWLPWLNLAVWVLYFAVAEGYWGRGVGKWLTGLRVVGPDGERPGLIRCLVRATVVPGAMRLLASPLTLRWLRWEGWLPSRPAEIDWQSPLLEVLSVAFILLCATSMRARNGYRGWHEWVSGTRVIRLRKTGAGRRPRIRIVLPIAIPDEGTSCGPYRTVGTLGNSGRLTVLDARDELLARAVWIQRGPREAAMSPARRMVVRPSRLHWLQGGEMADEHWDAFEAVAGAPLTEVAWEASATNWRERRHGLLALCEELVAAVADGTLPTTLALSQIWIGRGGRLKLLDAPLLPLNQAFGNGQLLTGPAPERAVALLRAAVQLCSQHQVLPTRVLNFTDELATRPATAETLAWAAGELRELVEEPTAIGWDDRLGILAVTIGTELSLYTSLAYGLPLFLFGKLHWPIERLAILFPLVLILPALMGFVFRGGPAFWLTRIQVLRSDRRPASRRRCAWRSFLAWSPLIALFGALVLATPTFQGSSQAFKAGTLAWGLSMSAILGGEMLGLVFVVAAIVAVARPQRGMQDELSGTWLAPK